MGKAKSPKPVKLIVAAFSAEPALLAQACEALVAEYGPTDWQSECLAFDHTDYYAAEFGTGLVRLIWSLERLIDPEALADIKVRTNELEQRWVEDGKRRVNLDCGYVSMAKLVLATTKDYDHRLYLRRGIYAEVTLHFRGGAFHPWPWTYPDYAGPRYCEMFAAIRQRYLAQMRSDNCIGQ
jgi:hypothetical protein